MKPTTITLKLFGIIAVFLTLLIGGILLFQTKYFGSYYSDLKQSQFSTAAEQAKQSFDHTNGTMDLLYSKLKELYARYSCVAALYPTDGEADMYTAKKSFQNGIVIKDFASMDDLFYKQIMAYLEASPDAEKPFIRTVQSDDYGLNYLTAIQTVTINDQQYILAMVLSLQSLDEAMSTMGNISWLAYGVGFLFALVLAAAIALLVTRPLVREIERKKALDAMRKDFIANASHEMKTPISIISGYAESLMDDILTPEERKEYEHIIYDESQKMNKLVRDMLEIAALQNDHDELNKTNIELGRLVEQTVDRFSGHLKRKGIIVRSGDMYRVCAFADERMMESVLVNLIANAISHTPEQGNIRISLAQRNERLRFEIENEGPPIPDDAIEHLWESFYRVDKAHNREDGRFGLGLFAVQTAIEKHNGITGVANTETGVLFFFEIPME